MHEVQFLNANFSAPRVQVGELEFDRHRMIKLPGQGSRTIRLEYCDSDLQARGELSCRYSVEDFKKTGLPDTALQHHGRKSGSSHALRVAVISATLLDRFCFHGRFETG